MEKPPVLNEELIAMNVQLTERLRELEEINDDLNNLLVSSEVPTLFLDPCLRIRRWTPATDALLRLIPIDVGRPLKDLGWCFEDPDLLDDAALVLAGISVEPREVHTEQGHWYLRRILPYCTKTTPINGVVITFAEMTARKHAELALADSERTLRRVTDALPALISRVDASLRYRFNNAAYERWFGLDRADILGKPVVEIIGEQSFARARPRMERALAGEGSVFDAWLPFQGDGVRCCQVEYIPDRRADGRVTGFFVLVIDITDRRRSEETIKRLNAENRARAAELRAVFDAAPVGIYLGRDSDCRDMEMNRAGAEILRLSEHANPSLSGSDAAALAFRIFHGGDELASEDLPMQRAARIGESVQGFAEDIVFADGEIKHLMASAAPLRNEAGDVYGCVGILADVTRTTQAERRYREALERLKLHIDRSPVASLEWAADTGILRWSSAAERVFGWSEAEALQGSLHNLGLFPEDVRESFADMVGGLVGGLVEHNHCLHLNQRKDGETVWCEWHNSVLRDGDGRLVSILSLALDVSEQQALQRSLREQTEQLAEADRRKNAFLAMLGHELRNPLAPVRNALDLLALGNQDRAKHDWAYAVIDRQTHHLERLVHDLLDVARITRGSITLRVARQDLGQLLHQALEVVDCEVRARGHEVVLEVPADPVPVRGDATRLVQVLSNVLHNAAKYTDEGGRIGVTLAHHAEGARVTVEDNGQGIAAEAMPSLFEAFTQGPRSLARAEGGLGLGLTLVKSLVDLHGGRVEIDSAGVGLGSRVTLTFPLDAEPAPDLSAGSAVERASSRAATPRKRVLVVDDSAEVVEAMSELLSALGHEVSGVPTGEAALDLVTRMRPDLILLDIGLPDIDGIEVARRLIKLPERKAIRLVAVSGYGASHLGSDADLFDAHLLKPAGLADLQQVLD
ncbi:PAS/PAC sensor hybrid histidine kinase [Thiorhodococcus drewsii AZ1]|uniref:histidine kinase n=1 Tax=Thiorhodococcus drewsii AZ1 TaxID=765913 RepID=G2E2B8_9GAMM|nr:PAS domain-containing protein [Thiorhodococcus drewsii]EGV30834.1 PAS/PAC sensor hybrid histidine kinase [Thiorhodococcus drewsii AZ1]